MVHTFVKAGGIADFESQKLLFKFGSIEGQDIHTHSRYGYWMETLLSG
jgi:hypothetical protein